ncbi:MAG TPA: ABC transporter ATP-binding protein [Candidatus Limnocylindria bacterium]|nr:ABC transporter ATP-binding protein [Candidatus Limnocylindria bacterium]
MQDPVLDVRSLTKRYDTPAGPLLVLEGVSLQVGPGETCSIVGPSGSGKTTLLGLCAGLDTPSEGTVSLAGNNLGALDEDARARVRNEHVGFVFQNFQLLPTLTALENVMVPAELRAAERPEERAIELLRKVGLGERLHHYPVQLSGGEQQRVALARAFINRPRLLFADEPTGNLDFETAEKIIEAMFELNRSAGTALVLVTHDLDLAQRTSKIIRMRSGRVVN